jgi:hypothetical protein
MIGLNTSINIILLKFLLGQFNKLNYADKKIKFNL